METSVKSEYHNLVIFNRVIMKLCDGNFNEFWFVKREKFRFKNVRIAITLAQ